MEIYVKTYLQINLHIQTSRTLNYLTIWAIKLKSYLTCPLFLWLVLLSEVSKALEAH